MCKQYSCTCNPIFVDSIYKSKPIKICITGILETDCNCLFFDTLYCTNYLFASHYDKNFIQSANEYCKSNNI